MRKTIIYSIYFIGICLFFIYYLFPSEAVINYIDYQVRQTAPGLSLRAVKAHPIFPPGLKLESMQLVSESQALFTSSYLTVKPSIQTMAGITGSGSEFRFAGRVNQGGLKGTANISENKSKKNLSGTLQLDAIQLQDVPALALLENRLQSKLSGIVSGNAKYQGTSQISNSRGDMHLEFRKCTVAPQSGLFNQLRIMFDKIELNAILKNRTLTIRECKLTGPDIDGSITGDLVLKVKFARSVLNLNGTLKPHAQFLAKLGKDFPAISLLTKSGKWGTIKFKITGTIENPGFSLN